MEKQKGVQLVIILVLVATVFAMSVAYAISAYTQSLTLTTTATVKKAIWDIHFVESSYTEKTGSVTGTATFGSTAATYTATLEEPGDFYEFEIDITNAGTFDAALKSITITQSGTADAYVTTTVKYDGTAYNASATGLNIALNKNATKKVYVKIAYDEQADPADLPSTDKTVTLTTVFNYEQVQS